MGELKIIKGSTHRWQSTLRSDGVDDDLSTAVSVKVYMWTGSTPAKINGTAAILGDVTKNFIKVEYAPVADDVDTEGIFQLQWEVTFSGGTVSRFPSDGDAPDTVNIGTQIIT